MACTVGRIVVPASTGNHSVTIPVAFQPVAVVFWEQRVQLGVHSWMFGCSSGAGEEWVMWTETNTETSDYNTRRHTGRTDLCIVNYSSGVTVFEANMVSLNSDGFTLNWTKRGTGFEDILYLAIGGDEITAAHAGTFAAGGSGTPVAVTAPGFTPAALIVAHGLGGSFDASLLDHMSVGIGVATSPASQYSMSTVGLKGSSAGGSATAGYHIHRTDAIACGYNSVDTYRLALDSFDATGFTVSAPDTWGDFAHGYLAIESEAASSGNDVQPDATGTQTFAVDGFTPGGVFFIHNGVDAPSTTGGGPDVIMRPGVGAVAEPIAGVTSGQGAASGVFRNTAPFGVWTSDGYQDVTMGIYMAGQGNSTNDHEGIAEFDSFAEDSFTIDWTTATSGADRAFGWLALPGEIPFVPQFYRVVPPY